MAKQKKRLRARITVGHDANGEPIIKWAAGYTQKELESSKEEIRRTYINGAVAIQRDILFGEFVSDWYSTYKLGVAAHGGKTISASTQVNYRVAINNYLFPVFANRQLRAITAMELQKFMNRLSGHSKTQIGDIFNILRNVFSMAYAHGIIERDPTAALKKPPHKETNERRALTDSETKAVLELIKTHPDGLFLAILYYTGLRRGEALGLRWSDVDFQNRYISVKRDIDFRTGTIGDVKTKASLRDVPIPDALYTMLQSSRQIGNGYIIKAPTSNSHWPQKTYVRHWQNIQEAIFELCSDVEHKGSASILTPHYFRHNYATLLYASGADVLAAQKFLGHSDPKTTLGIYTHLSEKRRSDDAEKIRNAFYESGNLLATKS